MGSHRNHLFDKNIYGSQENCKYHHIKYIESGCNTKQTNITK